MKIPPSGKRRAISLTCAPNNQHNWSAVLLVLVLWTACSDSAAAQAAPATRNAPPVDISGVWHPHPGARGRAFGTEEPLMQPWAAAIYQRNRQGLTDPNDKGLDQYDPNYNCLPPGPTRNIGRPYPFEIRQFPDTVFLLFELGHWLRRFHVDGRGHPDGFPITWMGHSVGTYEGDKLVVDTVRVNDRTWIDGLGHPHSADLHLVENWRRIDHETLEYEVTFDDPKTFLKPWGGKEEFQLQRPPYDEILEDIVCEHLLEMGKRWPTGEPYEP